MGPIELDLEGLRFPPKDLGQTLPQQLATLRAATRGARRERSAVARADRDLRRDGARSRGRQVGHALAPGPHGPRGWRLDGVAPELARDAVVPVLEAASVVGTMPNIPANRLSSQLDLGGRAFTVQAGEASGTVALSLAMRAVRSGELDAALVGAVDLSCESVHGVAMKALAAGGMASPPGDAAVVLVVKRLEDAERDGDRVYALIAEAKQEGAEKEHGEERGAAEMPLDLVGETPTSPSLVSRFGHSHAASDLVHVAAAALSLHHRRLPGGKPWLPSSPAARVGLVRIAGGPRIQLTEAEAHPRRAEDDAPRLRCFSGPDRAAVIDALHSRPRGPCRRSPGPPRPRGDGRLHRKRAGEGPGSPRDGRSRRPGDPLSRVAGEG